MVGSELNVFVQRRDLNRGWSEEGRRFRAMERHCSRHPGSYCFARPIYTDGSAQPAYLEFGVLRQDGELWVDCFDNRLASGGSLGLAFPRHGMPAARCTSTPAFRAAG